MTVWAGLIVETIIYELTVDAPDNVSQAEMERLFFQAYASGKMLRRNSSTVLVPTGVVVPPKAIPPSPMPSDDED